ncbi:MAG: FHA domain-containing protein [Deltaproteobacteria bacterium]|nr:FHA domain-containing protein [Deltaproteobacteria bacterium]
MEKMTDSPTRPRALLTATAGPNSGDSVGIEIGTCRLIGRHLSENETAFIDRNGNRVLDGSASGILERHLKDRTPATGSPTPHFSSETFERAADIIFADDSISRAHAMLFYDENAFGIIDLASTNGTFVNSERTTSKILADGDIINIGNSELSVHIN